MVPLLFRCRSSKARPQDDEYDELDTSYKTDRYSNVFQFHPNGTFSVAASCSNVNGDGGAKLTKRALSMLEMSEVQDMHDFGAVMDMNEEEAVAAAAALEGNDKEQDDFLFLDGSERSRENTDVTVNDSGSSSVAMGGGFITSSSGIMNRSKSMVSLPSENGKQQDYLYLSSLMTHSNVAEEKSTPSPSTNRLARSSSKKSGSNIIQDSDRQEEDCCEVMAVSTSIPFKYNDVDNKLEERKQVSRDSNSCSFISSNVLDESIRSINSNNNGISQSARSGSLKSSFKSTSSMDKSMNSITSDKLKRNVSFASLEIRSYSMTLGDAPTSSGPPVSLDWDYDPTPEIVTIDHYEQTKTRKETREMFMPASHRQYLLMREAGISRGAIKSAVKESRKIVKERERTRKNLRLQPMEEMVENTRRRIGRLIRKE